MVTTTGKDKEKISQTIWECADKKIEKRWNTWRSSVFAPVAIKKPCTQHIPVQNSIANVQEEKVKTIFSFWPTSDIMTIISLTEFC